MKILVFAIVILVLVLPSNAWATKPSLMTSSSSGIMGSTATFSVTGLPSNAPSTLRIDFTTLLSSFTTNSTGGFTGTFTIPYVPIGDHTVTASTNANSAVYAIRANGTHAGSIAYDPVNKYLYVTNGYPSTKISVINTVSNKTISALDGTWDSRGMAYDSANGYLYVASFSSNTVSVINPSTNKIIDSFPMGANPDGIDYDPTHGYLYVTNLNGGTVSVINATSYNVISDIGAGLTPSGVTYDPANGYLYVASFNQGTVSIIDTSSKKIVSSFIPSTRLAGELGVSYNSAKGLVYVTDGESGRIFVINATSNKITDTIYTGSQISDIYYDQKNGRLFVSNGSDTIKVLKIDDSIASTTVTIPFKSSIVSQQTLEVKSPSNVNCGREYISINTPSDLYSNFTRTTIVDYDGTKLKSTLVQGRINYTETTGTSGIGMPYIYDLTNNSTSLLSYALNKTSEVVNSPVYFTQALTNIGNKTVTIIKPAYDDVSVIVINYKNGTSVYSHHDSFANFIYNGGIMERPDLDSVELPPNFSLLTYVGSLTPRPLFSHFSPLSPDNYTMASAARFVGDVNGQCSMVYLWSQPVELTVYPEGKVPEFPYALPILLIGFISVIIFYRMKNW